MLFSRSRECEGCGELREELAKALSKLDALVLDWETLQDKVHRWMQRTSARARTEEREAVTVPLEKQLSGEGVAPALDPISAKLMARRTRRLPIPVTAPAVVHRNGEEGG